MLFLQHSLYGISLGMHSSQLGFCRSDEALLPPSLSPWRPCSNVWNYTEQLEVTPSCTACPSSYGGVESSWCQLPTHIACVFIGHLQSHYNKYTFQCLCITTQSVIEVLVCNACVAPFTLTFLPGCLFPARLPASLLLNSFLPVCLSLPPD